MFGWEFPPYSNGGLGTACYGLTKGLSRKGIDVTFVIPKAPGVPDRSHVKLLPARNVTLEQMKGVSFKYAESLIGPYMTPGEYYEMLRRHQSRLKINPSDAPVSMYGSDLFEEVARYAEKARLIALHTDFDIIHAHDWLTYKAGIAAKQVSGKPLVVHVHATDFDRTGGHPYQPVYDIEREGMHAADKIIAVSNYTKQMIVKHYAVPPEKVEVVHNAVDLEAHSSQPMSSSDAFRDASPTDESSASPDSGGPTKPGDKIVLFLGRLTLQKGPDYFLYAAKKVLEHQPNVKFMIAGSGDMERFVLEKAAELGISQNILYAGYLRGEDVNRAYQMADLYVMPSVSEPFGIAPLEALKNNTPVLISKQSGVSEVLTHCLKVDFWDVEEMANKMLAVLKYDPLKESLREHGSEEVKKFSWDEAAARCIGVYSSVLNYNGVG
ncbi:glycosyltransferase family 1 protein [Candidatus Woesearchaeota archaeon]|nr:MAG: glycosyltransferase family 1 protein [Candidatus Woesearchaeota archaeon]